MAREETARIRSAPAGQNFLGSAAGVEIVEPCAVFGSGCDVPFSERGHECFAAGGGEVVGEDAAVGTDLDARPAYLPPGISTSDTHLQPGFAKVCGGVVYEVAASYRTVDAGAVSVHRLRDVNRWMVEAKPDQLEAVVAGNALALYISPPPNSGSPVAEHHILQGTPLGIVEVTITPYGTDWLNGTLDPKAEALKVLESVP